MKNDYEKTQKTTKNEIQTEKSNFKIENLSVENQNFDFY